MELIIKKIPTKRSPEPDGFTSEFNQALITILHKHFQKKIEEDWYISQLISCGLYYANKTKGMTKKTKTKEKLLLAKN